jgi:hypothetical protein
LGRHERAKALQRSPLQGLRLPVTLDRLRGLGHPLDDARPAAAPRARSTLSRFPAAPSVTALPASARDPAGGANGGGAGLG